MFVPFYVFLNFEQEKNLIFLQKRILAIQQFQNRKTRLIILTCIFATK